MYRLKCSKYVCVNLDDGRGCIFVIHMYITQWIDVQPHTFYTQYSIATCNAHQCQALWDCYTLALGQCQSQNTHTGRLQCLTPQN